MSTIGAGYFMGGVYQGQQDTIANQQRAQLIQMQQEEADRKSTLFKEQQDDSATGKDAALQNLFASIPDPNAPAPGGQPGQASVPGQSRMPPGAMQGAGQPRPPQAPQAPQPNPAMVPQQGNPQAPQNGAPVRQAPQPGGPAGQAMPQVPGQQPMQPNQQPAPQAGAAPPTGTDDPIKAALTQLDQAKQVLQTPQSQKIASDGAVQSAQQQLHTYVAELRKEGHDPTSPGGSKPDPVQQARLMQLYSAVQVASAAAAKNAGADAKLAVQLGGDYAKVWMAQEHANALLKSAGITAQSRVDVANVRGPTNGAGGGARGGVSFDQADDTGKAMINYLAQYMQANSGKLPPGATARNSPMSAFISAATQKFATENGSNAVQGATANAADNRNDAKASNMATQKLAILEPAYQAFEKNFDLVQSAAKKYGLQGSQPVNSIVNAIRTKGGQADAAAFEAAVRTVQTEYGKIMTGSTGAAGTPVAALKKAGDSISDNMTLDQLAAVRKVLETDGKNVLDGFRDKVKSSQSALRDRNSGGGKSGGAGGPSASGGFVDSSGRAYSKDMVTDAAEAKGVSVDEFAKTLGLTRGN